MMFLLASLAFAQDAVFIAEGVTSEVTGPVHVVPKPRMDILLAKVTDYDDLQESFEEYQEKARKELEEKIGELKVADKRIKEDTDLLLEKDTRIVTLERKLKKANNRTILATGIATALVGGAVAAVVILK